VKGSQYGEGCRVEPSMGLLLCSLSAEEHHSGYERILDRIRPCIHERARPHLPTKRPWKPPAFDRT